MLTVIEKEPRKSVPNIDYQQLIDDFENGADDFLLEEPWANEYDYALMLIRANVAQDMISPSILMECIVDANIRSILDYQGYQTAY